MPPNGCQFAVNLNTQALLTYVHVTVPEMRRMGR